MKRFLSILWLVLLVAPAARAADKISDLPISTAPSTNTYIELADMDQVIKSRKYLLTNLATKASLIATNTALNTAILARQAASAALTNLSTNTTIGTGRILLESTIVSNLNDTAFASSWNTVITNAPTKNAVYDWGHTFDTDDDGKVNVLDMAAGMVKTDPAGAVSAATPGVDYAEAFTVGDGLTNAAGTLKVALAPGSDVTFVTNSGRITIASTNTYASITNALATPGDSSLLLLGNGNWGIASWSNITNALAAPNDTNVYLNGKGLWTTRSNLLALTGSSADVLLGNGNFGVVAFANTTNSLAAPNDTAVYLNGKGLWSTPTGGTGSTNMTDSGTNVLVKGTMLMDSIVVTNGATFQGTTTFSQIDVGTLTVTNLSASKLTGTDANTNLITATVATITNTWNIFDGSTTKFVAGDGTLRTPAASSANWTGSGTTNSSLDGILYAHGAQFTNTPTVNGVPVLTNAAAGSGNWTASGATNSTLTGIASIHSLVSTNGATFPNLTAIRVIGTDSGSALTVAPTPWTQVTPDGTNAVIDLTNSLPGVDKNFYYSLSTSNYVIFSNLVAGAQGTIWINAVGTPQGMNFSSSYDNFSTNEIAPVFMLTNRAIIAYKIGWGTDATNVMLAIKRK